MSLRQPPEKVRLIFAIVASAPQFPSAGLLISADARVMAGGQPLRADLTRHAQQRLELYICVAVGTRDGRAPGKILVHEGAHHARFKLLLEIYPVLRKIQVPCHAFGIVDVVERAATVLRRPVAWQLWQPALGPELHGQPDDGMPLLL